MGEHSPSPISWEWSIAQTVMITSVTEVIEVIEVIGLLRCSLARKRCLGLQGWVVLLAQVSEQPWRT